MNKNLEVGDIFTTPRHPKPCLVYKTTFDGGGTAHGPHDIYPDGHHVHCVQLSDADFERFMKGRVISIKDFKEEHRKSFYQSGAFTGMIDPKEVTLLGHADIQKTVSLRITNKTKKKRN